MLAIGGFWLNQLQKSREERTREQRAEIERQAAEQRAQTEREIAADKQREAALQAYIDNMSEPLLEKQLHESHPEDSVHSIARVGTLTVLPRLDKVRKKSVLQFLYESRLLHKDKPIVDLGEADLSKANLAGADLFGASFHEADLSGADLSGANLMFTNLEGASLEGANLSGANLVRANLAGANLAGANLSNAFLEKASLEKASLRGADLRGANLSNAIVATEQLDEVESLRGTIMPDGSIRANPAKGWGLAHF
jgi:uncharacterized protein YjbI with pentapeptide repeats